MQKNRVGKTTRLFVRALPAIVAMSFMIPGVFAADEPVFKPGRSSDG
jgi:hypothetical protein